MVKMKIKKQLYYKENGHSLKFDIGQDIAFRYEGNRYIAEIEDIGENYFFGKKIEINGQPTNADVNSGIFLYSKITECSLPSGGYY